MISKIAIETRIEKKKIGYFYCFQFSFYVAYFCCFFRSWKSKIKLHINNNANRPEAITKIREINQCIDGESNHQIQNYNNYFHII